MSAQGRLVLDVGHLILVVGPFRLGTPILAAVVVVSVSVLFVKVLFLTACMGMTASILILPVGSLIAAAWVGGLAEPSVTTVAIRLR